jgi:hypothetical protein
MEKHKFIEIIEFALDKGYERYPAKVVMDKFDLTLDEFNFIKASIFRLSNASGRDDFDFKLAMKWHLLPEAYFNYLQFLEFKHSLSTANTARNIAIASIIISSLLAITSIVTSFCGS